MGGHHGQESMTMWGICWECPSSALGESPSGDHHH